MNFYVIPKDTTHDKTKSLCFEWEFQPDEEDVEDSVYERIVKNSNSESNYEQSRRDVLYENLYDEKLNGEKWCPKCYMYAEGFFSSSLQSAEQVNET